MTLYEIKAAAAALLERATTDLTVNGVDLGRMAINQVRLNAELNHDFEFSRELVTVDVDGVVGGSLDDAVLYGTTTPVEVKTVVDVGLFHPTTTDLLPVEWTTVEDSLNRQREENAFTGVRYPTDSQVEANPHGTRRFVFSGDKVFIFPKPIEPQTFTLGIEAYTFSDDWLDEQFLETYVTQNPWTKHGHQYLLWAMIIQLNHLFKGFVFRQEGNLPPPQVLADQGLSNFIAWDTFKYEQHRRSDR